MIDFRYHLVSIIAVFMALAVGIALGSGPLKGPIDNSIQNETELLRKDRRDLRDQNDALQKQADYTSKVTQQIAGAVTAGRLTGRGVVLVTVPGVDGKLTSQVGDELSGAGATITGTVALTDAWSATDREGELDDVATRLVPPATPTFPKGDDARRQRISIILARALVEPKPSEARQVDPDAQALLAGLKDGGFLKLSGKPAARADFAVVVAPPAPSAPSDPNTAQNNAVVTLAESLDAQSEGGVVVGPNQAASDGGLVAAVRDDSEANDSVSTVDAADTASGRLTTVLALVAESQGITGAYGYGPQASAAMPDLAAISGS